MDSTNSTTIDTPLVAPDAPPPAVTFFKRTNKSKAKQSIRKRPVTPPPAASDSEDDDSDSDDNPGDGGETSRPIKRRKKTGLTDAASLTKPSSNSDELKPTIYAATTAHTIIDTNDATKQTSFHNENASDYLTRKNTTSNGPPPDLTGSDNVYRGTSTYGDFIKRSADAPPARAAGPLKAPTNIRTITVTDYAPDVCKDYKQTGFCGFGDSCKFLHAREDYAQGWQLDKDWEIKKKNPNAKTTTKTLDNAYNPLRPKGSTTGKGGPPGTGGPDEGGEDDETLKNIPFKCVICKEDYKSPIVTRCGHYFCEMCAIKRYKTKNGTGCAICGKRTDGVFNVAKGLAKKLELKKERQEAREREDKELERAKQEAGVVIAGGW